MRRYGLFISRVYIRGVNNPRKVNEDWTLCDPKLIAIRFDLDHLIQQDSRDCMRVEQHVG